MLLKIVAVVTLVIAGILIYAAVQPSHFVVSREATIAAAPEIIFPWVNNSKKSQEWMPWSAMDKDIKMTYSGPEEGVGSSASWTSEGRMGVGTSKVVEVIPNEKVVVQIDYTKPFEGTQISEMTLTKVEGGTKLKWSVSGESQFIGRVMCVFMNMDKMVGSNFETGFANLKARIEGK